MRKQRGRGYRKRSGKPRRRTTRENSIVRVSRQYLQTFTYANANTVNDIEINFSTSTGLGQGTNSLYYLSTAYAEYRVTKLAVTVSPYNDSTTTDNVFIIAYMPSMDDAQGPDVFTFAQLSQLSTRAMASAKKTVPTTLRIGRRTMLSTVQKWYATQISSGTNDPTQGSIIIAPRSLSTCSLTVNVTVVIEFRIPTVSSLAGSIVPVVNDEEVLTDTEEFKIVKKYKNKVRPSSSLGIK